MKLKHLLTLALMVMWGCLDVRAWSVSLSSATTVSGYNTKAFYNFASDADAIALVPTSGDFRYRDANNGWYNFGAGNRGADIAIPVSKDDIVVFDLYDTQGRGATINSVTNGTKNETLTSSVGHPVFSISADATTINVNIGRAGCVMSILVMSPMQSAYDYTVTAVDAENNVIKQLTSGQAEISTTIPLQAVIENNGSLYVKKDRSTYTTMVSEAAPDATVVYEKDENLAYFFEAESAFSKFYDRPAGNYSGGTTAGISAGASLNVSDVAAGAYRITVSSSVRRSNEDRFNVQTCTDGETWEDAGVITLTSNVGGDYSADVTIAADGSIRLVELNNSNMCHYVDYVLVHKLATATMSVGAAGYATFCAPFEVAVPAGVTASTATLDGDVVELASVGATIPANTPVVLEGTLDETPVAGVAVAGTPVVGVLTGVYTATPAPVGSYVLQNQTSGVGFYKVESVQPTVGANRAYLTAASGARFFGFGEETAIKAIDALTSGKAQIFDLQGRQLNSLQKGINVVNGVKILVK